MCADTSWVSDGCMQFFSMLGGLEYPSSRAELLKLQAAHGTAMRSLAIFYLSVPHIYISTPQQILYSVAFLTSGVAAQSWDI